MSLGSQLREARIAANLKISDVAARADLTPSHISQIERGIAKPSIGALNRICEAIGIRMGALFFSESGDGAPEEAGLPKAQVAVVRREDRRTILIPRTPIRHELLCPNLQHSLEAFLSRVPPGANLGDTPLSHRGEEWAMVLKGILDLTVGGESFMLRAGDAILFDCSVPHSWRNTGQEEVEIVWVATPPHF